MEIINSVLLKYGNCARTAVIYSLGFKKLFGATNANIIAPVVALGYMDDVETTNAFFDKVKTGELLRRGDAAYVLREKLLSNIRCQTDQQRIYTFAITIKALNAFALKKKIVRLSWNSIKEDLPQFVGYHSD